MQVLDQQIAPALALAEQRLHLRQRDGIDLPPFREIGPAPSPRPGMNATVMSCPESHSETSGVTIIAKNRQTTKQSRANQPPGDRDCFPPERRASASRPGVAMTI